MRAQDTARARVDTPVGDEGTDEGGLVLQRSDLEGENKIAVMIAEDVDWATPVGQVLGAGMLIEVLAIEDGLDADGAVVHLRLKANDGIRIEREERLTVVDGNGWGSGAAQSEGSTGDPMQMKLGELEQWLLERRGELVESDAQIRALKEKLRKAHSRGYQYRTHPQHATFELLKNEMKHRADARERLKVLMSAGNERLKALRRDRASESMRDYESRFYRAAKRLLSEEQLASLRLAAQETEHE
jgi:hypothetical protein